MKKLLTEETLRLQKLAGILTENQFNKELHEGWRETIMGAVMTASSLLGSVKGQNTAVASNNPQATQQNITKNSLNIPFGALFQSGHYLFADASKETLSQKLTQIGNFIVQHPKASFNVSINSSESQVPNYDAEGGQRVKLEPGQLAQKRSETAKFAIESFISNLRKENKITGNVSISNPTNVIGKTPYTQGEDPRQDKFTREQFVNISITLTNADTAQKADTFNIKAKSEDRYFNSANHAIADIQFGVRSSTDINKGGATNTGYSDVLVKWLDKMGNETGEKSMLTSDWWNKNIGPTTTLTDKQITDIKNQSSSLASAK